MLERREVVGLTLLQFLQCLWRGRRPSANERMLWPRLAADSLKRQWKSRLADAPGDVESDLWDDWLERWYDDRKYLESIRRALVKAQQRLEKDSESLDARVADAYFRVWSARASTATSGLRPAIREISQRLARKLVRTHYLHRRNNELAHVLDAGSVRWKTNLAPANAVGRGLDSRIVEIPLAFELCDFTRPGRILDAGCALNEPFVHRRIGSPKAHVVHFTLSAEKETPTFDGARFSYVFGDMRELAFREGWFDRIVCISTLEHVGMDNRRYDSSHAAEHSPEDYLIALRELYRVLAKGGEMLVTFPFGAGRDHGWYQVFDQSAVERMLAVADVGQAKYFHLAAPGWCEADPATLATVRGDATEEPIVCLRLQKLGF